MLSSVYKQKAKWSPDLPGPNMLWLLGSHLAIHLVIHSLVFQTCHSCSKPGRLYIIDAEVINSGVPYADNFMVFNRYCLTRVSANKSRLRVTSHVKYRKSVWGLVKSKSSEV